MPRHIREHCYLHEDKVPYLQLWNKEKMKQNQIPLILNFHNSIFIEFGLRQSIVVFVSKKV